jgi:hypothetical protein
LPDSRELRALAAKSEGPLLTNRGWGNGQKTGKKKGRRKKQGSGRDLYRSIAKHSPTQKYCPGHWEEKAAAASG